MIIFNHRDVQKREPSQAGPLFSWQSAYADALDVPDMLNGSLYENLRGYFHKDDSCLRVYYTSRRAAFKALQKAYHKLARSLLREIGKEIHERICGRNVDS